MHTERRSPCVLEWRITCRRPVIVDVILLTPRSVVGKLTRVLFLALVPFAVGLFAGIVWVSARHQIPVVDNPRTAGEYEGIVATADIWEGQKLCSENCRIDRFQGIELNTETNRYNDEVLIVQSNPRLRRYAQEEFDIDSTHIRARTMISSGSPITPDNSSPYDWGPPSYSGPAKMRYVRIRNSGLTFDEWKNVLANRIELTAIDTGKKLTNVGIFWYHPHENWPRVDQIELCVLVDEKQLKRFDGLTGDFGEIAEIQWSISN